MKYKYGSTKKTSERRRLGLQNMDLNKEYSNKQAPMNPEDLKALYKLGFLKCETLWRSAYPKLIYTRK